MKMHKTGNGRQSALFLMDLIVFLFVFFHLGFGQNADDLLKKAEGELRRSNSSLMSGRYEDVFKQLQDVDKIITEAQKGNPDPTRMKKVVNYFMKQKEKVEEKLSKKLTITFSVAQEETGTKDQTAGPSTGNAAGATGTGAVAGATGTGAAAGGTGTGAAAGGTGTGAAAGGTGTGAAAGGTGTGAAAGGTGTGTAAGSTGTGAAAGGTGTGAATGGTGTGAAAGSTGTGAAAGGTGTGTAAGSTGTGTAAGSTGTGAAGTGAAGAVSAVAAKKTPTVGATSAMKKSTGTRSSQKLPYNARKPMQQFNSSYASFESYYNEYPTTAQDMKATSVKRMGEKIEAMKANLVKAGEEAAKKNVSTHPDFDEAQNKLDQSEKKYAGLSGEYQKQAAAAAELSVSQANDAEGIKKLYRDLRDRIFDRATGYAIYYNNPAEVRDLLEQINGFEMNDKAKVEQTLSDFTKKYGTTDAAIRKSTGDGQAASSYAAIVTGLENVEKTRGAMTESLLQKYEEGFSRLSGVHDFFKVKVVTDLKQYIDMALRFSPDNLVARKTQADYKPRVDKALKEFYASVDKRKWPGNTSNAPANADKLAKVALDWFKNDIGWGKRDTNPDAKDKEIRRPLAVGVKGPWSVQKTNLLGQPIIYGLPVLLAVQVDSEKDLDLVRVYDLTMRTAEKAGVKEEPPFVTITVGNSYYIRQGAL